MPSDRKPRRIIAPTPFPPGSELNAMAVLLILIAVGLYLVRR